MTRKIRPLRSASADEPGGAPAPTLEDLLVAVSRGDQQAYEELYSAVSAAVYGLVKRVLRDPAQSEEVTQEVLLGVWTSATRFDPRQGSAMAWVMTMAHRRAVDRVRSEQSAADRHKRLGARDVETAYDEVAETVQTRLDREAVRRCLESLTPLQRESVTLAYYTGRSYREVAEHLDLPVGTVKTRMRDGLIRLRDCLGVAV